MKCYKCNVIGHRAKNCQTSERQNGESANMSDEGLPAVLSLPMEEAILASNTTCRRDWCVDSGCTSHMCNNTESFVKMNRSFGKLNLTSTAHTEIEGKGTALMIANTIDAERVFKLKNTLYVPDLRTNLVSVGKVIDNGYEVIFDQMKAEIVNGKGDVLLTPDRRGDIYYIQDLKSECNSIYEAKSSTSSGEKTHLKTDTYA